MSDDIGGRGGFNDAWEAGSHRLERDYPIKGRSNPGWGTIDTEHQLMMGSIRLYTYSFASDTVDPHDEGAKAAREAFDWYAVIGHMRHSVTHGDDQYATYAPRRNWASVGYYATQMSLVLEAATDEEAPPAEGAPAGRLWDAGPVTTVGSNSTSFNIGGGLSAGFFGGTPTGGMDVSGGFSASFSTPDVTIGEATVGPLVRWNVQLPGVGFMQPGIPANPLPPSYIGYQWEFAAIFEIPKGQTFQVRVHPRTIWEFDWTRGITNDVRTWEEDLMFNYERGVVSDDTTRSTERAKV